MVGRDIAATDIGKNPKLIKAAQEELGLMDVIVCGQCLNVSHFIKEFEQHKQTTCSKDRSNVRECNDTKPKIWAFLLWKSMQLMNTKNNNASSPNSWALYQQWVKMDENARETWLVAGKTIQSFSKISQGGLQEMPVKITKTVVNNNDVSNYRRPLAQSKPQIANLNAQKINKSLVENSASSISAGDAENEVKTSPASTTPSTRFIKRIPVGAAASVVVGAAGGTPLQTKVTTLNLQTPKTPATRFASRTLPNSDEVVEGLIEKIVAKRFNPHRKTHEYLVKWEDSPHESNTWEPMSHLKNVQHLLDIFEKQLARQKETRAALQAKALGGTLGAASVSPTSVSLNQGSAEKAKATTISKVTTVSASGRPARTSKTKAYDQVKQWVASSSEDSKSVAGDSTTTSGGIKRKLDSSGEFSDTNDLSLSGTNTMEDLEEDLIPSHTVKRLKNGNAVTVESSSKVVRVNGTTQQLSPATRNATVTSSSDVPASQKPADVIITKDNGSSGIVKKEGFSVTTKPAAIKRTEAQIRVLSKGESAVTNTGIVRLSGNRSSASPNRSISAAGGVQALSTRVLRVGSTTGRQTPTTTGLRTQQTAGGATIQQRTSGSSVVQRKLVPSSTAQQRTIIRSGGNATGTASSTPQRLFISRGGSATSQTTTTASSKAVTPEQKILQLSKSGDLKVTKKMMTREDLAAQRLGTQQQQRQPQVRSQSQVQIQKVQQLAPPSSTGTTTVTRSVSSVSMRKQSDGSYTAHEEQQSKLCPITGKILGQDSQQLQNQMLTAAAAAAEQLAIQQQEQQQQQQEIDASSILLTGDQMLTNEDGSPIIVTGDDGVVYQVAGKNAAGQTILVTQGPDGEQQFAYVAAPEGEESQMLTLDNAVAEAVSQLPAEQQAENIAAATAGEGQYLVKTTQEDGTTQVVTMTEAELQQHQLLAQQTVAATDSDTAATSNATNQLTINTDGQETNIPAEIVQAELPSPGGTRRVVLLLQDGNFMMTEMHDDEFKALNINL